MLSVYEITMTTNEVKDYLDISHFIFNNLMKQGQLTPINKDTWRLDGSFLFSREEVEKLKDEREIEGITLYQASKEYPISINQLEKWIEEEKLVYTVQEYRNRQTKFVKEDDIRKLVQQIEQASAVYTFSQKHNVVLFQKFIKGNTLARIISIPKRGDIILLDEFGNNLTLRTALKEGYESAYILSDKPRSHHQRFVKFRFPKSDQLRNNIFNLIDNILQYVSPRNLKVSEEEGFLYFEIRQSLVILSPGIQIEWINELTPYIIEGKIVPRVNHSVYLDSNTVTKPVILTNKEYEYIKKITSETNSSIEEFIAVAIRDKINQHLIN
ncbi:DNA-binding protein [Bacillus mycoides]|uniref:DNA-binding protein n=1 Tax=Bacillus thuringiensis serovar navarrensis TaxID=339658 RepID=A0A243AK04_BACTU|nr:MULTISPECIES: DNA-binding protein [Bacillus cereus group]MED1270852.1 DNA-binding protein [Bacillus mycoides]OTY23861.1 DNA-binding protein [Bacillus thuringiensis serovar navarrensis]